MKKVVFIFIMIITFIMPEIVSAKTYNVRIVDEYVNLRSAPSTSGTLIERLEVDTIHTLIELEKTNNWYKITSASGNIGYISANYAAAFIDYQTESSEAVTECEIAMKNAGFTDSSYWPYLCFMKETNPNWNFVPIITNLEWQDAVENESICGRSYIMTSDANYIDSSCVNQYEHTWYPASKKAVSYYMDPRNFLAENFIFQFEYLKYDTSLESSYVPVITSTLSSSNFYNYHLALGNDFSSVLNTAAKDANVSPTFLAARILQELGSKDSLYGLFSGIEEGYVGYYNFYNYGVTDYCATTQGAVKCGLDSAVRYGWNTLYNALKGGAVFIGDYYVNVGQYTTYLQKFNVVPTDSSKLYVHQYQTNIMAPMTEARTVYSSIDSKGLLDNAYTFYIPVYNNMDKIVDNTGSGATGEEEDAVDPSVIEISTIVTTSGYRYQTGYISNFEVGTLVSDVLTKLESVAGKSNVTITNKDGFTITDGLIKTGDKITIKNSLTTESLVVIVYGDTSGDGKIDALDLLQVQKNILGTYNLVNEYALAADTSKDGKIDALDLLQVQKNLLETYKIEQ